MTAPRYYQAVVSCAAPCPVVQNCNRDQSLPARWLPRGSTSRCRPGRADLMVVLLNPGTPLEIEDTHFAAKSAAERAEAAWAFTEAVLEQAVAPRLGAGRSASLGTLMKHLAHDVLDCPIEAVLDRVVVTNAVRCSTLKNFGEYSPEIRSEIGMECVQRHLVGEIEYWKPKLIVACGKPARALLAEARSSGVLDVDFMETHHPSALGNFIKERKKHFETVGAALRAQADS